MKTALTHIHDEAVPAPRAAWIWLGMSLFGLVLAGLFLLRPPCPDVATFDYVGWRMSRGETLYVEVIEQNFPGVIWLHALASSLFGNHLWSFRLIDCAVMLLGCWGMFRLAAIGGSPLTRYLVVLFYQLYYVTSDLWMAGQRDIVASNVMIVVSALAVVRMRGGASYLPVAIGVGMAFASLTRPTCVLFVPLIYLVDLLTRGDRRTIATIARDVVIAGLSFTAALAVVALIALPSGALRGWYQAAVVFNAMLYSQTATVLDFLGTLAWLAPPYWWLIALAVAGSVSWFRGGERQAFFIALTLGFTGLMSCFVQGKALGYHLAPLYLALVLFASEAIGGALAYAARERAMLPRALAAAVCLLALYGPGRRLASQHRPTFHYLLGHIDRERMNETGDLGLRVSLADIMRAVDYARAHTTAEQTILPWNRAVVINYLAERKLPTPLATIGMLDLLRDSFPQGRAWLATFERTLREHPPALVFTYNEQLPDEYESFWTPNAAHPASAMVRTALSDRYRRVARFGPLDAYALK